MNEDRMAMSQQERDRLKVMSLVLSGQRTQAEAARLLQRSIRQIRRLQRRLEDQGDCAVIHKLRGRPSNNHKAEPLRQQALEAYRREYSDFGPTLAAEKLAERGLAVCDETLRLWLLAEGLWRPRRKRDKHRRRRRRRECFGELTQADGSPHDWLEGRGEPMDLLVMIDDATSKALARFYPAETTEAYLDLLGRYLRKHGRMGTLYTDRNSIFWGKAKGKRPARTQVTRALKELGIEWIPAYSPQAKGRVERFNATAQDRLVKELRLAGAATIERANAVLDKIFLPWFNRQCTVKPTSANNAHRPIQPSMNLPGILSVQHTRTVANDYTIRLDNVLYQLLPPAVPGLRGGKVIVEARCDGSLRIRFKNRYLKYKALTMPTVPGALPPDPRSLSLAGIPAEAAKPKGRAAETAQPSAVHPANGRSGRTPAEPCPPDGDRNTTAKKPWRPPPEHPWRKFRIKPKRTQEDILTLAE